MVAHFLEEQMQKRPQIEREGGKDNNINGITHGPQKGTSDLSLFHYFILY
jgi:hypothetical protein